MRYYSFFLFAGITLFIVNIQGVGHADNLPKAHIAGVIEPVKLDDTGMPEFYENVLTPKEHTSLQNRGIGLEIEKQFAWLKFFELAAVPAVFGLIVIIIIFLANRNLKKEIAKRRQAEMEVRQSREEFRSIAEHTYGLEFWYDAQGKLRWFNPFVEKTLGYSLEECLAMDDFPSPLLAPGDIALKKTIHEKSLAGQAGSDVYMQLRRKDGRYLWLYVSWNPVYKQDGTYNGYRISALDRTEQKIAEQALEEAEKQIRERHEQIQFIMDFANMYYWEIDYKTDEVSYASTLWFTRQGYAEQEIPHTRKGFRERVHPDDMRMIDERIKKALQEKKNSLTNTFRFRGPKTDQWFWVDSTIRFVELNDQGALIKIVGLNKDITQRQQLLTEVQKSQKMLNFSLDNAGAFYWQTDLTTGRISYASLALFKAMGYSESEVPEFIHDYFQLVHPDDQGPMKEKYQGLIQDRSTGYSLDYRFARKDGKWAWLNIVTQVIEWDDNGNPTCRAGVTTDITERQDLLEQVRQSREQLKLISDHTYDWQSWRDLDGNLLWVNRAVERVTGYSTDECMAMTDYPRHLVTEEFWDHYLESAEKVVRNKTGMEITLQIRKKDGSLKWVSTRYEPIMDEQDRIVGIAGATKDITEQKQARQELLLMSKVFKDAADPILIMNLAGDILDVNQATVDTYGYTRQEICGRTFELFLPRENINQGRILYQKCIDGQTLKNVEWTRKKKDGTTIPVLLSLSLLYDDTDSPIGVASVTKDISELKKAEQELKNYKDHLEELVKARTVELEKAVEVAKDATRAKSDFLANMSHEIRTPLNAVIGFAHLALQTELDDSQHDYLNKIQNSSKALLGIINDILDFSKIEAGKLAMENIEFRLDEVLDTVTNIVGIKAQQKGLEVVFNIDPNLPEKLIGDPLRLGQILLNLTGNSLKFTEQGEIVVGCRQTDIRDGKIEIEFFVQDSGIGLSLEQQEKLFKAFSQADSSTTRKYGGTGLGLFICKTLSRMMGGCIWATSEPGQGATFYFTVVMEKAGTRMARALQPSHRFTRKKVLVVDDNAVCRTVLCAMLEAMSFRVIQAQGAEQGIEEIKMAGENAPFDLVLMDWKMPGMDGIAASREIKTTLGIKVPSVVMVTAYAREDLMQEAKTMGLDGYLVKPVSPVLLFETIMSALGDTRDNTPRSKRAGVLPGVESIKGARLLVVEDNEINRQVARGILEGNGFVVETADNGRLGVEAVNKTRYDAVLMDIQMPEMSGYEATIEIRKDPAFKDLPIIAMTANAMAGDREKAARAGMNDHVAKPINVEQLLGALGKWIKTDSLSPDSPDLGYGSQRDDATPQDTLGSLPGIDVQNGLSRLGGNIQLFKDLLIKFAANQKGAAEQIKQALAVQDMDTAQRLAHTGKGVAGNIGALELFKIATDLDSALKEKNMEKTRKLLPVFDQSLNLVIQGIKALEVQEARAAKRSPETVSAEDIKQMLSKLKDLLEDDDTEAGDAAKKLKGMISDSSGKKLLTQLSQQVGEYDFDTAIQTLDDLCRVLS